MKTVLIALTLLIGLVAWSTARARDTRLQAIKGYRSWKQATPGPQDMTPSLALSCVGPLKPDQAPNPHVPKVFLVYVNAIGSKAMTGKAKTPFPDGSVIVKEKYDRSALRRTGSEPWEKVDVAKVKGAKPELLTVMVRKNGKWSYFAVGPDGNVIEGDTTYCASCHDSAKASDYVFRPYVTSAASLKSRRG